MVTLALLGTLLAAWSAHSPADATFPGTNGLIAFISNRDGDFDIYTMPVGGIATRLTTAAGFDGHPAWSANGDRIAFISHRDEPTARRDQIYVMNADGTGQTALTSGMTIESKNPTWSPDGTKIAFQRSIGCCGADAEIFVMNADGSGLVNVTNNPAFDGDPDWQPLVATPTPSPTPTPTPNPPLSPVVGGVVELAVESSDSSDAQPSGWGHERGVAALAVALAAVGVAGMSLGWRRRRAG